MCLSLLSLYPTKRFKRDLGPESLGLLGNLKQALATDLDGRIEDGNGVRG